jgi:hypothetical protein
MPRTTDTLVRTVIDLDAAFVTDAHILTANELVTEVCVAAGYSDARLELIERWLSAHFCAIHQQISASEGAGSVNQAFQFRLGLNLSVTMWGQQALILDTAMALAGLSKSAEDGKRRTVGLFGPAPHVDYEY